MRCVPLLLLLCALPACRGDGSLTERDVRRLVPDASGLPQAVLEAVDAGEWQYTLESHPLCFLLAMLKGEPSDDFRLLFVIQGDQMSPRPWTVSSSGMATWIPAESLRDIEVHTEGERASGSFRFRRDGLFEGRVAFAAERRGGEWTMTEFRLPLRGDATVLRADGNWRTNLKQDWNSPEAWHSREMGRIEAQMPRDREITLRVVDLEGRPVRGAEVRLRSRAIGHQIQVSGDDGRAKFDALPAGEMRFELKTWGDHGWSENTIAPARVKAVPASQEIVMPFREGVAIRGVVLAEGGQPVREASVYIDNGREELGWTQTDANGRWTLAAFPGEAHTIEAISHHGGAVVKDVVPGNEDVVLRLSKTR